MSEDAPIFVRWVQGDEPDEELVNEAKYRTWTTGVEHALLSLDTGGRLMIKGGPKRVVFEVDGEPPAIAIEAEGRRVRAVRIEWHTHPVATGPSDDDRKTLVILGQAESRVHELGGETGGTSFGQDKSKPVA